MTYFLMIWFNLLAWIFFFLATRPEYSKSFRGVFWVMAWLSAMCAGIALGLL